MKNVLLALSLIALFLISCSTEPTLDGTTNSYFKESSSMLKAKAVDRPFKLNGGGDYSVFLGDGESCSQLVLIAVGNAQVTHLGATSFEEEWCWNGNTDDLGVRTTAFVAANGDELYGMPISILYTGPFSFQEEVIFTGGTGRFENAEGSYLVLVEGFPFNDFGGTFVMTASGSIKY